MKTSGIHHITAIVNDPQVNARFYSRVLGLRLVKKTVNFDRPEVYHLYFGNESGDPGTVITFFPWPKLPKGRVGTGQLGVTSYVIPKGSMDFWENRLRENGISFTWDIRFNETFLQFEDPDGLKLEMVEREEGSEKNNWRTNEILPNDAIKGFGGAILNSAQPNQTADVLENVLGMEFVSQEGNYLRFKTDASIGNRIDIKLSPSVRGLAGAGTVHHIAWRARDHEELQKWRKLLEEGYKPTEIKERNYFKAIYFHEPGGILFEIATDRPGFAVDEAPDKLGTNLKLPSWLESKRKVFEDTLPPIKVKEGE